MVLIESYAVAVLMCVITMICWGSWANTQKLSSKEWRFQLFYWDYCIGVLLLTLIFAFTLGSMGSSGRTFMEDLRQADMKNIGSAFLGGVIFNIANILLVAAIDIAGMAVAFPIGIGLALVIGVVTTYYRTDSSNVNPLLLFAGVACVAAAIILDAMAYRRLPSSGQKTTTKGIVLSILCGILMGQFFPFVAAAIPPLDEITDPPMAGMLTPYTALVFFALGLFLSNFILNTLVMMKPFAGDPVPISDYFTKGSAWLHFVGILGGMIWGVGMSFSIVAGGRAGYPISYGLGQGATMVAALWGVFIWREFQNAREGTNRLLALMFVLFVVGLSLIVVANTRKSDNPTQENAQWREKSSLSAAQILT
jgi:glucose uptake protein